MLSQEENSQAIPSSIPAPEGAEFGNNGNAKAYARTRT
jgi:hypothetical protein